MPTGRKPPLKLKLQLAGFVVIFRPVFGGWSIGGIIWEPVASNIVLERFRKAMNYVMCVRITPPPHPPALFIIGRYSGRCSSVSTILTCQTVCMECPTSYGSTPTTTTTTTTTTTAAAAAPVLKYTVVMSPAACLLTLEMQNRHNHALQERPLTASQGSFHEKSFFTVETTA